MRCRHCQHELQHSLVDLGFAPPSNAYLQAADLNAPETSFPLRVLVCDHCWLVQTEDYTGAEQLFDDEYAYFSSVSSTWLAHARDYCGMITGRLGLNGNSRAVEVASNDGYLLKNFVEAGIPCVGVEPTASTAAAAQALGIDVRESFFGEQYAATLREEGAADLIIGNNVYAHVPDINDFTRGLTALLAEDGTVTLEFPHLLRLLEGLQFDTIYHEHFSYLSLGAVSRIFAAAGLRVYDVEELPTHGGSLRVYGCHGGHGREDSPAVQSMLEQELAAGLEKPETYSAFQARVESVKDGLLAFLLEQKQQGRRVLAYGAAAKGNTLLNFAGVKPDLLPAVFDAAESKQGKFLPGSHIPVLSPEDLPARKPDVLLVLPWNIAGEVHKQLSDSLPADCSFVVAVPSVREIP